MGGAVLLLLSGGMDTPDVVTIFFLDLGDLMDFGMLVLILDMIYSMGPDCMDWSHFGEREGRGAFTSALFVIGVPSLL